MQCGYSPKEALTRHEPLLKSAMTWETLLCLLLLTCIVPDSGNQEAIQLCHCGRSRFHPD